ncbi:MAG: ABC transporter ATP-binding protein [Elusimicrobia bacterium RIFCSPHIGHO2_01_FULL_64_10]|nr:MAG: ABC transporter ATP-binding protein [Elusimicrobia bacterium RIFCSPHIGHO2_01_FULL_64_10]
MEVEAVSFAYPGRRSAERVPALDGVSFNVGKGEVFGLLGPNGGGKTTLFKVLSTASLPSSGRALVFGRDLIADPAGARRDIGIVFQSPSLDRKLTVKENLTHQGRLYGWTGRRLEARIGELLSRTGLSSRASDLVETLSGGLQRRAEIAKGMLHVPKLLLMDEPTTGLDPGARRDFWTYVAELKREGMTILLTTHLMEEAERCDRLAILSRGKVVAGGTPAELKEEIGGDVITVLARDPAAFSAAARKRFGLEALVLDGTVRIEREKGHEFIPDLVGTFPGEILSVTVGKPTLEDVFVRRTGHRFWGEEK